MSKTGTNELIHCAIVEDPKRTLSQVEEYRLQNELPVSRVEWAELAAAEVILLARSRLYEEAESRAEEYLAQLTDSDSDYVRGCVIAAHGKARALFDPRSAIEELQGAFHFLEDQPNASSLRFSTSLSIGTAYASVGEFSASLHWLKRALKMATTVHSLPMTASSLHNLGATLGEMKRYSEAKSRFLSAARTRAAMGDIHGKVAEDMCASIMDTHCGKQREALQWFDSSIEKIESYPQWLRKQLLLNRSRIHSVLGNYEMALEDARRASGADPITLNGVMALLERTGMAELLVKTQRIAEAVLWIESVSTNELQSARASHVVSYHRISSLVYEAAGRFMEALQAMQMANEVSDRLVEEERRLVVIDSYEEELRLRVEVLRSYCKQLSQSELFACALFSDHCSTKEVAERLHLSVRTVETIRQRAAAKLGLSSSRLLDTTVAEIMSRKPESL